MKKALNVGAAVLTTSLGIIAITAICYAMFQVVTGNVTGTAHFEF